ncbi:MAG: hypothetical protein HKP41_08365 [Desulfobacterales bacterium]|nr:hypothetical protein [Deltaproteobacteria bacterium]NNK94349.1 hypothetical protein [Desulfobacterales bacterium]
MFKPKCLPILIGSLPLQDHREAMQLILSSTPDIPLWPQLPKNSKEGMIRQFLDGFPGLHEEAENIWVDTESADFTTELAVFYEDYLEAVKEPLLPSQSRFSLAKKTASGFFTLIDMLERRTTSPLAVKGQITGPMTTGIGLRDQTGTSIFYDDNLRDILTKLLTLKARWQVERLHGFATEIPPLLFIDEPGIVGFGSTAYAGVSLEMVTTAVAEVIAGIKDAGGLAGIHICANGDWNPALHSDADIISFDAFFYFDNFILYEEQLRNFLLRGGILAWGIVPTGNPVSIEQENVDSLYGLWLKQLNRLCSLGFTDKQLMNQTLIAPSCGTGSLPLDLAQKVLRLTCQLAEKIRQDHLL